MSAVAAHYEKHLGPVYTWMIGDLEAAFARGRTELDELGIEASANGTAVDLGAGFDLLHERAKDRWRQRVSSYLKLRLHPERVVERLTRLGFVVRVDTGMSGMIRVVGTRS